MLPFCVLFIVGDFWKRCWVVTLIDLIAVFCYSECHIPVRNVRPTDWVLNFGLLHWNGMNTHPDSMAINWLLWLPSQGMSVNLLWSLIRTLPLSLAVHWTYQQFRHHAEFNVLSFFHFFQQVVHRFGLKFMHIHYDSIQSCFHDFK